MLFLILATVVTAIPARDKQNTLEELDAYGLDVMDHYPNREPKTADDYYKIGATYLFGNMPQVAAEYFLKGLKIDSNHVDLLIGLSVANAQSGDVNIAMENINKALSSNPKDAKVQNMAGALRLANAKSLDHLRNAEENFRKSIEIEPKFLAPRMNLARMYLSMRKLDMSVKEYEAMAKIQPDNVSIHTELARAYMYSNSLDKAMVEAQKAVKLSPDSPVTRNTLGEIYAISGKLDKAVDEFQEAVKIEPTYAVGYKNIGRVYIIKGMPDKAIEEYKKALSHRPNYGEARSGLGDAYIAKGMYTEAAMEYDNAVKILPVSALFSVPAYNNLAYIYAEKQQNLDKALLYAQRAKQLVLTNSDVSDTLGWIYYKKGDYDKAIANLEDAVKISPENPTMRYHLGLAYHKKGDKSKAGTELKKSLSIGSKFPEANDAKKLLNELSARQ